MDLIELKAAQQNLGKKLENAWAAFKQLGKVHKTPGYKKRRLDELKIIWDEFLKNDKAVIDEETTLDSVYIKLREKCQEIYNEYSSGLASVADTEPVLNEGSSDDEVKNIIANQGTRLDSLQRVLAQVQDKKDTGEEITISFSKVKIQSISNCWNRIVATHEEFGAKKLNQAYLDKYVAFEAEVEETLLFLQEEMDNRLNDQSGKIAERRDGVKLQRVTIPKFTGDYFKWVTFRDLFVSLVKNNGSLSKAQKLQMLKTNLGGEPENLIIDLTISDANFDAAWDRLIRRYENNRILVAQHLSKLMFQPSIKWESHSIKTLLDTTDQVLLALKNLGRPIEYWDDWIVFIVTQKFSDDCRKDWEKKIGAKADLPTWTELKAFLEEEFRMVEGLENLHNKTSNTEKASKNNMKSYHTTVDKKGECPACNQRHYILKCPTFRKLQPEERWVLVKKQRICFRCLNRHEDKLSCEKEKACKKCERNHHTWLHEERNGKRKIKVNVATTSTIEKPPEEKRMVTVATALTKKQVLLATAIIKIENASGHLVKLRALLDSGSQGSMVTARAADLLQWRPQRSTSQILTLGDGTKSAVESLTVKIRPRFESKDEWWTELMILKKLTKTLPDDDLHIHEWTHLQRLKLADPTFYKVGRIDALLGADIVAEIMENGISKGRNGSPIAQKTKLGWIVSGKIDPTYPKKEIQCMVARCTNQEEDYGDLQKFWELEELHPKRNLTQDEQECEKQFLKSFSREANGTFTVRLPFKDGKDSPTEWDSQKINAWHDFSN